MRKSYQWALGTVASLAVGCGVLGTALFEKPVEASAEEVAPIAYINVGAFEALASSTYYFENTAIAVDSSTAGTAGANGGGLGVFASYRMNASVSVAVTTAGEYQVAALVDGDGAASFNGAEAVSANGKRVVSATVTATDSVTVSTADGKKLYAVMVAPKDSKILMHSEWTAQQVVVHGKLIQDELTRGCPAYYSDGSVESAIEYSSIPAGVGDGSTGLNENFTSTTATGRYTATDNPVDVERVLITMPEKLVYFLNAGSVIDHVGPFGEDSDPRYSYNKTVFDYYKSIGSPLKNDVPDAESTGGNSFGHYENGWNAVDKALPYPFNTGRVTRQSDFYTSNLGFRLPDVEAGSYKIYLGTISYWHKRVLGVKINNVAKPNITVTGGRTVHTFDVTLSAKGTVDIFLTGSSTDEALASFVALQKAEDAPVGVAPANVASEARSVGLKTRSLELTGVEEGSIVQIYGGARPYKLIYEEVATAEKFNGSIYTFEYDESIANKISTEEKICVIQRNRLGYGGAHELAVTSIKNFAIKYSVNGVSGLSAPTFTTGNIVVTVSARSEDGIDKCQIRKGYGEYEEFTFEQATYAEQDYTVKENGSYEFVFWSGTAKYGERVEINYIDNKAPIVAVLPLPVASDKFPIKVVADSVAGIEKYEVVYGGEVKFEKNVSELQNGQSLDEFVLELTEEGEYLVTVTSKTQQTVTAMVVVGTKPVYSTLKKMPRGNDCVLTFGCLAGYGMKSLEVYRLEGDSATKLSIFGDNQVEIYDEGSYTAIIKTNEGTTEVYGFSIEANDFKKASAGTGTGTTTSKPGVQKESYTGTIAAAGTFIGALIALAVTFFVSKKKPVAQTVRGVAEKPTAKKTEEKEVVKESAEDLPLEENEADLNKDDEEE